MEKSLSSFKCDTNVLKEEYSVVDKLMPHSSTSHYLGFMDQFMIKLVSEKTIICTEIEKHFKSDYDNDTI